MNGDIANKIDLPGPGEYNTKTDFNFPKIKVSKLREHSSRKKTKKLGPSSTKYNPLIEGTFDHIQKVKKEK